MWQRGDGSSTTIENVEHQDPSLKIAFKSHFTAGTLSGGMSGDVSYTIDGVEKTSKAASGTESWTSVYWQGASLVIAKVVKDGYRVTVTRETWTLSADGRTLTKNKGTINMDGVTESSQAFQKQ